MANKWDEDTMPVELAIQRELAYRKKLALQLKPDDDLLKDLIPLQVQSSLPSPPFEHPSSSVLSSETKRKEPFSTPIQQTLPQVEKHQYFHGNPLPENTQNDHKMHCMLCNLVCSSDFNQEQHLISQKHQVKLQELLDHPSPSTILSGAKRKEISSIFQDPLVLEKRLNFNGDQMTEISPTDNRLHCKLCNVRCPSDFNLEQHMNGQKHKAKLHELVNGRRRWCEVCKIPCMNEDLLKMHLEGRKHKTKVLELKNLSTARGHGDAPADQRSLYCELCRIWCIDEHSFKQHVEGKKHKLLVHDNFPKKRVPWQRT